MSKLRRSTGLVLGLCLTFFAACDDSSSDAGYSIPQYKNEAALPDTCEMEVAKVGSTYFACFEDKWIEVTDSATVEQFKEDQDEDKIKENLKKLEKQLKPKAPAEPESSADAEEDVESSDEAEPESSPSEDCSGRRCDDSGKSSSSKKGGNDSGRGDDSGSGSGEGSSSDSEAESGSSSGTEKKWCGDVAFNPKTHFCASTNNVLELCGGEVYSPSTEDCKEGRVVWKCGSQTYDPETEACSSTNKVLKICGTYTYDSQTHFCGSDNKPYQLCNGETFETQQYFCYESELYEKCGEKTYIPTRQFCWDGVVKYKDYCGGVLFVPDTEYCKDETTVIPKEKCGSQTYYNPETHYCDVDVVYALPECGGSIYNPQTQFCGSDEIIYEKCSGKSYDPAAKFCKDGTTITDLYICTVGSNEIKYNPEKQFCAEYLNNLGFTKYTVVKYVTIGNLKWMAENWNVPVTGSVCHNDAEECDAYGRLYPKSAARKSNSCPKGWHIPTNAEAESMVATLDGVASYNDRNTAAIEMRSSGFNPVYGGYYNGTKYSTVGTSMFLWTSDCLEEGSCLLETSVSYILTSATNGTVSVTTYNVSGVEWKMSIRCVADK